MGNITKKKKKQNLQSRDKSGRFGGNNFVVESNHHTEEEESEFSVKDIESVWSFDSEQSISNCESSLFQTLFSSSQSSSSSAPGRGTYNKLTVPRRTEYRKRKQEEENQEKMKKMKIGSITNYFSVLNPSEIQANQELITETIETETIEAETIEAEDEKIKKAMEKLENICNFSRNEKENKKDNLTNFDYLRYLSVQRYLSLRSSGVGKIESSMSISSAIFNGGPYKAKCIRYWSSYFVENGDLPLYKQGKHAKIISFLEDEEIQAECLKYLRSLDPEKVTPKDFAHQLQHHISPLIFGFSIEISETTAINWLHKLNFSIVEHKKSCYVDGHEREDVVEDRIRFLESMKNYEKLMSTYSGDDMEVITPPILNPGDKEHVLVVHDETIFRSYDGKKFYWCEEGKQKLKKKGEGKAIMVSTFLCECHGILQDTVESATVIFTPGKNDEGYWTNENLVDNIKNKALPLFNRLHPNKVALFCFDHSQNHEATSPDALVASKLNLSDGGKNTPIMRETNYNGLAQKLQYNGIQKGIKTILTERGLWIDGMRLDAARALLSSQPDFAAQKNWIEETIEGAGHKVEFFPKFHCELNFIELFWAQTKRFSRNNCDYTFKGLQNTIPLALESVPLSTIRRCARKCFRYMEAYRYGLTGKQLEFAVKKYKSHRKIPSTILQEIA